MANYGVVRDSLRGGDAVVVPNPLPLTYVVTAREPHVVNLAKGRPADQPVALWAHHPGTLDALGQVLDLDGDGFGLGRRLLMEELVTLLVPVRAGAVPDWLAPAHRDGWALLFGARWEPVRPVLDEHPVLYVSSANRTGQPPASTLTEALTIGAPVLTLPEPPAQGPRQATTTLRLHSDGRLALHRPGAQDMTSWTALTGGAAGR
ncbi:hypothetical protein [Actinoplanes sp. NPDC051494]|uniref:hypothetical protein n=1 Tax=Actinoplanes sp. NPDC051494 TaxID=3363907 RepID=UPI0037B029C9